MAANRFDPEKLDASKEERGSAAPSPDAERGTGGGGLAAWLPLIVALVAMPLVAAGVTQWVLLPQLRKGLSHLSEAAPAAESAKHAPSGEKGESPPVGARRESVPMTKLLVNVAGTMGSRYLLTSLTLVSGQSDFKAKLEQNDAQLRDMACGILSTKTITDLEKPGARNLIRSELITGFNNVLGAGAVQEIYITEFAIQ